MCVVSNLGDDYGRTFPYRWPNVYPTVYPEIVTDPQPEVTKEEFEALRKEIEELKELLKAAKRYDDATGQADCEKDEKIDLVKRVAELVGVDLEDLFGEA